MKEADIICFSRKGLKCV